MHIHMRLTLHHAGALFCWLRCGTAACRHRHTREVAHISEIAETSPHVQSPADRIGSTLEAVFISGWVNGGCASVNKIPCNVSWPIIRSMIHTYEQWAACPVIITRTLCISLVLFVRILTLLYPNQTASHENPQYLYHTIAFPQTIVTSLPH